LQYRARWRAVNEDAADQWSAQEEEGVMARALEGISRNPTTSAVHWRGTGSRKAKRKTSRAQVDRGDR
jgi:hypothetical protein